MWFQLHFKLQIPAHLQEHAVAWISLIAPCRPLLLHVSSLYRDVWFFISYSFLLSLWNCFLFTSCVTRQHKHAQCTSWEGASEKLNIITWFKQSFDRLCGLNVSNDERSKVCARHTRGECVLLTFLSSRLISHPYRMHTTLQLVSLQCSLELDPELNLPRFFFFFFFECWWKYSGYYIFQFTNCIEQCESWKCIYAKWRRRTCFVLFGNSTT